MRHSIPQSQTTLIMEIVGPIVWHWPRLPRVPCRLLDGHAKRESMTLIVAHIEALGMGRHTRIAIMRSAGSGRSI